MLHCSTRWNGADAYVEESGLSERSQIGPQRGPASLFPQPAGGAPALGHGTTRSLAAGSLPIRSLRRLGGRPGHRAVAVQASRALQLPHAAPGCLVAERTRPDL